MRFLPSRVIVVGWWSRVGSYSALVNAVDGHLAMVLKGDFV